MQQCEWIWKTLHWAREAGHKKMHTRWFYLYEILGQENLSIVIREYQWIPGATQDGGWLHRSWKTIFFFFFSLFKFN